MVYVRVLYNSFVLGMIVALLFRLSTFIEMRMATGWFIIATMLVVWAGFLMNKKFLRQRWLLFRLRETLVITIGGGILLTAIYGWERLKIVPASTIRELVNRMDWSFGQINLVLGSALASLFLFIVTMSIFREEPVPTWRTSRPTKKTFTPEQKKKFTVTSLVIIISLLCYLFIPPVRSSLNSAAAMLIKMDIEEIRNFIHSFGIWAPLVSILLMMFQSIIAPLPAFVITFANAWLFGWMWGAVISWTGAMLGAMLCFYIAKFLGRPVAEKIVTKKALDKMDGFFEEYGKYTIVILRLIPIVSFDAVSYAAGLTGMGIISFLVATGIGQLPATIVYSIVGGSLGTEMASLLYGIIGFCLLVVFSMVMKKILVNKKNKGSVRFKNERTWTRN